MREKAFLVLGVGVEGRRKGSYNDILTPRTLEDSGPIMDGRWCLLVASGRESSRF